MATKIIFTVTLCYILTRAVGHSPGVHRGRLRASNAVSWLLSFLSSYRRIRFSPTRQHVHSSRLVKCRSLHSWPLREPFWCVPGNPIAVRHISAHGTLSCNSCTARRRLVRGPPLPSCQLCLSPRLPICRHTALKAFGWSNCVRSRRHLAGTVAITALPVCFLVRKLVYGKLCREAHCRRASIACSAKVVAFFVELSGINISELESRIAWSFVFWR